jgi:hypothetical protein
MVFGVFLVLGLWVQTTPQATGSPSSNIITLIILFLFPVLIMWFTRKELTGFGVSGNKFLVQSNKPSKKEVQEFLLTLQQTKTAYLREAYFEKANNVAPEEELRNLSWLRQQGIISQNDLEDRKQKIETVLSLVSEKGNDDITIYYQNQREDIVFAAKYIAKNIRPIKNQLFRSQLNSTIIISVIIAAFIYITTGGINFKDALFVGLWTIISYFLFQYIIRYNFAKRLSSMTLDPTNRSLIARNTAISLKEDGIVLSSDLGSSKLPWSTIQQTDEDVNHVYLMLPGANVIIIPKRAFIYDNQQQDFIGRIQSHLTRAINT